MKAWQIKVLITSSDPLLICCTKTLAGHDANESKVDGGLVVTWVPPLAHRFEHMANGIDAMLSLTRVGTSDHANLL
jgi:hypothetical protein